MESTIWESFELPSKGLIYDKPINNVVTLRSMTTLEEMKRTSPTSTPYKVMSDIIEDCMKDKPDIHVYNMCIGDYQYLLHRLRVVTYGNEYKMTAICPKCGEKVDVVGDLDSLEVKEYNEDLVNKMNITLPKSNKLIELKFQTPKDLDLIPYRNKEMQKKSKTNIDYSIIYTLVSLIKKVDGRVLNSIELEEFVKQLSLKDVNYLLRYATELNKEIGVGTDMTVKCPSCGEEFSVSFRITSEFFGPTI